MGENSVGQYRTVQQNSLVEMRCTHIISLQSFPDSSLSAHAAAGPLLQYGSMEVYWIKRGNFELGTVCASTSTLSGRLVHQALTRSGSSAIEILESNSQKYCRGTVVPRSCSYKLWLREHLFFFRSFFTLENSSVILIGRRSRSEMKTSTCALYHTCLDNYKWKHKKGLNTRTLASTKMDKQSLRPCYIWADNMRRC
jgi:hypothetical protein